MNFLQYKTSLKTKLSILVAVAVMLVVIALGLYFDSSLKESSLENARTRILHGYQRLAYNLKNIERSLSDGIAFVQSDEQMQASVELINNYQDKNYYNIYLIDEEKKLIASQLLNRVKFSFNDDIALYDKNNELIAFVTKNKNGYQLNYISYVNSKVRLFKRYEQEAGFTASVDAKFTPNILYRHVTVFETRNINKMRQITYHKIDNKIAIKSHQNIFDGNTKKLIGHIEMSRILDDIYFFELSEALNVNIKHSFNSIYAENSSKLYKSIEDGSLSISEDDKNYFAVLKQGEGNSLIYFLTSLNKTNFNLLLNESRRQFLIILALVTLLILLLMRYIINGSLAIPLSVLMKQIDKIKNKDYSGMKPVSTGDELETVSVNINQLALTIQERESSLKSSIDEQKKTEEKLKATSSQLQKIASRLPGMVYQFELHSDGSMCFPYISDAINDVYHLTAKEVQDDVTKIFEVTHPDDIEKLYKTIDESASSLTPWKLEYRIYDKDGQVRWLYGNSIPEKRPNGDTLWHGFVTDITKNKETEETLRRTQKMDALGKLTGGIAHDYNNMLGVVVGYAELLKEMLREQPELQNYADQILHAGDRGAKLTKKLLSFSRHKASDAKAVNINKVLQNEQHMLEKTLTARIKLDFKLDENLWSVCVDESELEDAILNMCINSMHAIENIGQLTIETSNKNIDFEDAIQLNIKSGDYVQVIIKDNGCGLDEIMKEKIFDPFYSTKGDKGTGLGLTQVYGFIKRSGGAIKVDSQLGQGTKFTLYFPYFQNNDVGINGVQIDVEENLRGTETILIVDDEPSLLDLGFEILQNSGYKVFSAESAKVALGILKTESVDVLLSDVIMPEMDGYELAALVQSKYPDIKIQLVSGFSGELSIEHVDSILSKNLLRKPYTTKSLLKKIQALLH